jgi:hypothetical protein
MPEAPPADPLVSRLRDPLFARAYESWLQVLVERAERARPRRHHIVISAPETMSIDRPSSLAG